MAIREGLNEDPWLCDRDPGVVHMCKRPEGIPHDNNHIWVMDRPGIPRLPAETDMLVFIIFMSSPYFARFYPIYKELGFT